MLGGLIEEDRMSIRSYGKSVATYSAWAANTSYALGSYVRPVTPNGFCYKCTTAGTSGLVEPAWIPDVDTTVVDGSVIWTCEDYAEAENPLSVELDSRGRGGYSLKDIWVKSGASATFYIYGSYNGVDWRLLDTLSVPVGELTSNHKTIQNAYPRIAVGTAAVSINEIEIVAGE
jgi:hypothetical protein